MERFDFLILGSFSAGYKAMVGPVRRGYRRIREEAVVRLLLVEDSRDLATWLAKVLRADGYAVDVARDGEEADDLLRLASFDLVILDLGLPGLDGLGVLRRLRGRGGTVPVILLTANASLNGRVKGLD